MATNPNNKTRLEPWEELPADKLKRVNALTDAAFQATNTQEINLAEDTYKVAGQNWACVSFVSPDGNQKNKSIGMKIRGVFDKQEEAVEHVKSLIRRDPMFDIYVCEMYNWCLVPPDPEKIKDQNYQNEELNKIVGEYRRNQMYAKEHFEERKREMIEQAAEEARMAALKKLEESEAADSTETVVKDSDEIIEGTLEKSTGIVIEESATASPSELMDSMVNGACVKK